MKIDSPTFLSETTFISASVQFSSGSQKFGDTTDDIHQFTGSISISETGSFSRLAVGRANTNSSYSSTSGGDVAFGVDASSKRVILRAAHVEIGPDDYWGINAFTKDSNASLFVKAGIKIFTTGNNQGMRIYNTYTGGGYNSYIERHSWSGTSQDGGHLVLRNYGSGGTQVWHGSNVVVDVKASATGSSTLLTLEDNKISGSSTSTGSFGRLETAGAATIDKDLALGSTGRLLLQNQGTQAAPAITFNPDTNTGIYQNTDNELDISINNNTIVNMDYYNFNIQSVTGLNVGISDAVKFNISYLGHASGSSTSTGSFGRGFIADTFRVNSTDTSATDMVIKSSGTDHAVFLIEASDGIQGLRVDESSNGDVNLTMRDTSGNADISIHPATNTYFNNNGNFGIGTTSPGQKLTVAGNISTGDGNSYYFLNPGQYDGAHTAGLGWNKLQLGNNGHNYIVAGQRIGVDSNAYLDFYTDNQSHPTGSIDGRHVMRMNHDGNIFVYSGSLILEGNDSGNISGSSTSTGSFGQIEFGTGGQSVSINGNANTISVGAYGATGGGTFSVNGTYAGTLMQLTTSDNQWSFSPVDTYGLRLAGGSSGTFWRFRPGGGASKEVEITVDGHLSGSATSTGSFGSVSTKRLGVGSYYVAESGGTPVTSGDITLGSTNTGKKVGLELYHSSNPVSFKLHYDSGGGAVTLDNAHQNYINDFIFKKAGTEYHRIGTALNTTSNLANNFFIKSNNTSYDFMILDHSSNPEFYIDTSTRNVGIGEFHRNNLPDRRLHIYDSATDNRPAMEVSSSNDNGASVQITGTYPGISFNGRGRIWYDGAMTIDNAGDAARPIKIRTQENTAASGKDTAVIRIMPSGSTSGYFDAHGGVLLGRNHQRADSQQTYDFAMHISSSARQGLVTLEDSTMKFVGNNSDGLFYMQSSAINHSTMIRMSENDFQGGFIKYDGSGNKFIIGTHNAADEDASNDIEALTISRDGTQISGSSTSTGSFGKVVAKERISIFSGLTIENEAALSIYSDNRKAIHIDHDDADEPAVYIDTSNSADKALEIYSNAGSGQNTPLVDFHADNTGFDQNVLYIRNDGTGTGMLIDQEGNAKALEIDSEQTSNNIFHINNPAITTGYALSIEEANNLTTGRMVHLVSNSSTTDTRNLFYLSNEHTSATGATLMYLKNDSTGTGIEFVGSGHAISGSSTTTGSFGQIKAGKVSVLDESRFDIAYLPDLQFYEEAMYTATLAPQGSGTITINSDWNKLGFTRIGNKVHVHGNIIVSSVSSPVGTNVALNLPYQTRQNSSSTNSPLRQTGTLVYYNGSNWYSMPMMIDENDTVVLLLFDSFRSLGGSAPPNVNTIASGWQFRIDLHYFIGRFD